MNTTVCVEIRAQYLNACLTDIRKFLRPLCRVHKPNAPYEVILKFLHIYEPQNKVVWIYLKCCFCDLRWDMLDKELHVKPTIHCSQFEIYRCAKNGLIVVKVVQCMNQIWADILIVAGLFNYFIAVFTMVLHSIPYWPTGSDSFSESINQLANSAWSSERMGQKVIYCICVWSGYSGKETVSQ
jgi:hypothetical protein